MCIRDSANRLLLPFGLHHLVNSVPWFAVGSFTTSGGVTVHGDVARFLSGDPTAGSYMTGFFPIMMFALPAAALAIYHEADLGRRKVVGGVMLSGALTSFLTGVTEPLEFAFMFVAWPLYLLHAVLTGTSMALVNALGVKDGFGFSAGAIDSHSCCFSRLSAALSLPSSSWPSRRACRMASRWLWALWYLRK